jgi:hypothetical protein
MLDVLEPPMKRSMFKLLSPLADYPPQIPRSTYRRTGTLGRTWTTEIERTFRMLRGTVGNNTIYGPLVQSEQFQAAIHRGRWPTDEQVKDDEERGIIKDFEESIEDAIR